MNYNSTIRDYLLYLLKFNSINDLSIDDTINIGLFIFVCNKLVYKDNVNEEKL